MPVRQSYPGSETTKWAFSWTSPLNPRSSVIGITYLCDYTRKSQSNINTRYHRRSILWDLWEASTPTWTWRPRLFGAPTFGDWLCFFLYKSIL